MTETSPLITPDGKYLVVRGRLWRTSNPHLDPAVRDTLVQQLMSARREVHAALRAKDEIRLKQARAAVQTAKVALGERGAVWWTDGTADLNRKLVRNTRYAEWFAALETL